MVPLSIHPLIRNSKFKRFPKHTICCPNVTQSTSAVHVGCCQLEIPAHCSECTMTFGDSFFPPFYTGFIFVFTRLCMLAGGLHRVICSQLPVQVDGHTHTMSLPEFSS